MSFRSVSINGKRYIYVKKRFRLWDWINILLSGTLLDCTKLYKNLPLKFCPLKRSFSLLRETKCFEIITALICNLPVWEFVEKLLGTDVKRSPSSASSVLPVTGTGHVAPGSPIKLSFRENPGTTQAQ